MQTEDTHVQVPSPRRETRPFGITDRAVLLDASLPLQVKVLYSVLTVYANSDRECWPSRERLSRETGMARSTVDAAIKCAEKIGLIEVRAEFSRDGERSDDPSMGEQTSNRYKLHDRDDDFDTYPPGKAAQYAMRAYARALATIGKVPSDKGRKQVGAWFKTMLEKGQTHERTWELFRQYVDSGVAGGDYSWLVDDPRPAPEPDPDDFVAYIKMREEVEEWKVATFGEEFTDPETSRATGMYGAEQPIEKIRRTLMARIREDQAEAAKERWSRAHAASTACPVTTARPQSGAGVGTTTASR